MVQYCEPLAWKVQACHNQLGRDERKSQREICFLVHQRNRPAIGYVAQFGKEKMRVCAVSSSIPTPISMEAILKAIQDLSMKINSMAPSFER